MSTSVTCICLKIDYPSKHCMQIHASLYHLQSYIPSAVTPHPRVSEIGVMALPEAGKVRVTWSRPTLGPGQVITGYSVQYRKRGTPSYTTRSVSGSSTTSYTITNLNLGTVYEVRVASVGPLGLSGYCCGSGKQITTHNCESRSTLYKEYFCM